ncbi:MAG: 2-aminoethylphosphonate--pyruvate transaminase [bacterium]|nr:2-aminoethylphosphonate--pyruvate transaminase [bacterium]
MPAQDAVPGWKDKILFTPGPLTTSRTVKQAMLSDLGSRDTAFIGIVREIRDTLVALGGATTGDYEAVLMQGSGTFAVEAVLTSTTPPDGKVLIVANGAYGKRMAKICSVAKIDHTVISVPEHTAPTAEQVKQALADDAAVTNVAVVHCETTTGIMNPVKEIGEVVRAASKVYFVDAMSCFGAVPTDLAECSIDFLVSSANKCIEGVPGFGFVLARHEALLATEGFARSLSLDVFDQWRGLEGNGQFRFTPPTHALLAFRQALRELDQEGGVEGRAARYRRNYETLVAGMRAMGFSEYLEADAQGYIITSFRYPEDPQFDFEDFYQRLNERDQVIYPGKVSDADCFRIGNIGRVFESDVRMLLSAIRDVTAEMGFRP